MNDGTIDITDLVDSLTKSWILWATAYSLNGLAAVPGFSWVLLPVISDILKAVFNLVFTRVGTSVVSQAFFLNTAIRKSDQARDYVTAVTYKNLLPPDVDGDIYQRAEHDEILAFYNFVRFTN